MQDIQRVEILVEEASMAEVLKIILPQILPQPWNLGDNCFLRPHSGKQDLQKSIPHKIQAFSNYHEKVAFIIIHDQDSHSNCKKLKNELLTLSESPNKLPVLVRIACKELESWYIGDFDAIEKAYPKFKTKFYKSKAKFRSPDNCENPKNELQKILPEYQEVSSARKIAPHMNITINTSTSFQQLISGIQRFLS